MILGPPEIRPKSTFIRIFLNYPNKNFQLNFSAFSSFYAQTHFSQDLFKKLWSQYGKTTKLWVFFAHAYIMSKNWGGRVFFDVSWKKQRMSKLILCLLQTALFLYVGLVRRTRNSPKKQPASCCWRPSRLLCCSAKKATARAASPSDETYFYNLSELPEWINLPIHLAETLLDANYEDMWNVVLPMYGALRKCFF